MSIVAGAVATTLRVAIGWQPKGYRQVACAPQIGFILVEIRLSALSRAEKYAFEYERESATGILQSTDKDVIASAQSLASPLARER
jgi:hypothetical protein